MFTQPRSRAVGRKRFVSNGSDAWVPDGEKFPASDTSLANRWTSVWLTSSRAYRTRKTGL